MKKSDIVLILGAIVVVVISIFAFSSDKKEKTLVVLSDNFAGVQDIAYSDYDTMLQEEKTFVVVVSREGCSYCDMYAPIMEEVSNENSIPIYKVDIATFTDEEMEEFSASNSVLKKGDWGTPTTIILKGSEVIDSLAGYTEKESLIEFFNNNISFDNANIDYENIDETEETDITEDVE